jgi:hypothetical protein
MILGCAAAAQFREPEIQQLYNTARGRDDVRWFEVSMDDPFCGPCADLHCAPCLGELREMAGAGRGRVNLLCLQVCLGKSAHETPLGGVYLPDLHQRPLKSGCPATADGEIMQVG